MHILMVLDHIYPPDQRVENEAESLIKAGFQVSILSVGKDDKPETEVWKGTTIKRIKIPIAFRNKLRGLVGSFNIYSIWLTQEILKIHKSAPIDAIHTHDLYLAQIGVNIKNKLGIPFVLDLHENYVNALQQYAWSTTAPGKWFISDKRWKKLERKWVQAADISVVVIEEMKKRYLEMGIENKNLITIPNTPNIEGFRADPVKPEIQARFKNKTVLLYSGGFDLHRGLHTAIEAMSFLKQKHPNLLLLLVGDGRNKTELEAQAKKSGVDDVVQFEGWQPQSHIRSYINSADIGLIPHVKSIQTDASIPHKLGYYMSEKLPIVSSNCDSLSRMVNEYEVGRIFTSENPESLADEVDFLLSNPDKAKKFAKNGVQAAENYFNWNSTVKPLLVFYQSVSK